MSGPRTAIMMFHRVSGPALPGEGDYALPRALFEEQMRWLGGSGRPVIPLGALSGGARPDGSVVLTFDDGCDTDATVAAPLLVRLGMPATFFVTPARLGRPGCLSWEQLEAVVALGFEVGSHGLDHALLGGMEEAELRRQLGESKSLLEARLRRPVRSLALPGGSGGERARRAAREAGYETVVGSRPAAAMSCPPGAVLPRLAVRRAHGLPGFQAMVGLERTFLWRQAARYAMTRLGRGLLGDAGYGRLHGRLVRRAGRGTGAA